MSPASHSKGLIWPLSASNCCASLPLVAADWRQLFSGRWVTDVDKYRKAINKPATNGVDGQGKDDRNSRCRLSYGRDRIAPGHNDIDVGINKFCRNLGEAFGASLCPAIDYFNCAPVDPAMFAQLIFKGGNRLRPHGLGNSSKKPDHRPSLLRP